MGKSKVLERKRKEHSLEKLLEKAEELVDQCQPEVAVQFYEKALLQAPQNTFILDMIGELSTELDQPERALEAFQKSISLEPSSNPSKWFYAAQLLQGEEAEKYLNEGIAYLRQELQHYQEEEEENYMIRKQICDAYCSLGELYMTDMCDVEDAEVKCEGYFQEALKYDIGLPEAIQSLATLRLTQQKKEDAIELLEETYRRLLECDEHTMPTLEFRIQTGKLLMEIEKYEEASDILESVMQEDDENAELWFLVGTCYRFLEDFENSLEFFEKCLEMLEKLKKELQQESKFYLQDQLTQVENNIVELKDILSKQPMIQKEEEEEDKEEQEDTDEDMKD